MRIFGIFLICFVLSSFAMAQIFVDDFESYADNAALTAAYDANTITGLSTAQNYTVAGSQSAANLTAELAGTVLTNSFPAMNATPTDPITIIYYIYDSNGSGGGTLNGRACMSFGSWTGGIWGSGTFDNFIILGPYHSTSPTQYSHRAVYGGLGWVAGTGPARTVGWHKMTMVIDGTYMDTQVDDTANGGQNYTEPATGWNCFRLGSPAGQTYIDAYYDDIEISGGVLDVSDWALY